MFSAPEDADEHLGSDCGQSRAPAGPGGARGLGSLWPLAVASHTNTCCVRVNNGSSVRR